MRSSNLNQILGKFSDAIKATEINCFLVHFSSYFTGLIPIKIRTRLRPASGGFVLAFQQENTRRLRLCSLFSVSGSAFSDTRFFLLWGSSTYHSRPSFFWFWCFILQALQYAFEFFVLGQSSEVMLASDPFLLCQNMRFRSFISIRPFINNLADGHAYSLEMIKG